MHFLFDDLQASQAVSPLWYILSFGDIHLKATDMAFDYCFQIARVRVCMKVSGGKGKFVSDTADIEASSGINFQLQLGRLRTPLLSQSHFRRAVHGAI